MICPACGEEFPVKVRFYPPTATEPTTVVAAGDTVKVRRNPAYQGPDLGHDCADMPVQS